MVWHHAADRYWELLKQDSNTVTCCSKIQKRSVALVWAALLTLQPQLLLVFLARTITFLYPLTQPYFDRYFALSFVSNKNAQEDASLYQDSHRRYKKQEDQRYPSNLITSLRSVSRPSQTEVVLHRRPVDISVDKNYHPRGHMFVACYWLLLC
jgi:hypothetical protein